MNNIQKIRNSIRFQHQLTETVNARKVASDIMVRRSQKYHLVELPKVMLSLLKAGTQGNVYHFNILDEDDNPKRVCDFTDLEKELTKIAFKICREWFPRTDNPEAEDVNVCKIQKENHYNELILLQEMLNIEHPNMVKIYYIGDGYIEMEKVGDPVWLAQEKMLNDKKLTKAKRKAISADLANGVLKMLLVFVENQIQPNDAHRDNCLIGLDDGQLKFIDGGLRRKIEKPFFLLQDPNQYQNDFKEDYKDYHPIDTIIRILQDSGSPEFFKNIIISLQKIGQDKEQKEIFLKKGFVKQWEYFGETLEDIISSENTHDDEKQKAFNLIKDTLINISLELEKYADPNAAKDYFVYNAL